MPINNHSCLVLLRYKMFAAKRAIKYDISSPFRKYLHSTGSTWRRNSHICKYTQPSRATVHHIPSSKQLQHEQLSLNRFGRWLNASSDAARLVAGEARAAAIKSGSVSAAKTITSTSHKSLFAAAGHYYKCYYDLSKARLR